MLSNSGVALFSFVDLDGSSAIPLFQQLNTQIRQAVLAGRLPSGIRLPSSRTLAIELEISRTTVVTAFEQLMAEGYLESRVGAGTYVTRDLARNILELPPLPNATQNRPMKVKSRVSRRGSTLLESNSYSTLQPPASFLPNQPAYDQFPFDLWARILARQNRKPAYEMLNYGNALGYPPLRRSIAEYLRHARGLKCDENQIIVVTGAQMAMSLTAWVLLDPGDAIMMEDPSLLAARDMFSGFGARIIDVPVDNNGMNVAAGIELAPNAKMAVVAPSHQYPLGVTLSLSRRLELLAWANQTGSWIVEDDYDSEFRFSGAPLAPMQTIDQNGRVIYIGTFSKVLFPSLRVGYLVVPPELVDIYGAAIHFLTRGVPSLPQAALADFIDNGHFLAHIRRMRLIYSTRHKEIVKAIRDNLGGILNVSPAQTGMNVIGWLPQYCNDMEARQILQEHGILCAPMSVQYSKQTPRQGLLLGFGCTPVEKIQPAVQKMAHALSNAGIRN